MPSFRVTIGIELLLNPESAAVMESEAEIIIHNAADGKAAAMEALAQFELPENAYLHYVHVSLGLRTVDAKLPHRVGISVR